MEKKEYSKNDRAEKIVGKRMTNGIIIDFPCELDYHCPVCKYEQVKDGNYDERLDWSEYEGFIYCHKCNKDYPSCLCMPNKEKATDIYLDCIDQELDKAREEVQFTKEELEYINMELGWMMDNFPSVFGYESKNLNKNIREKVTKLLKQ